MLLIELIACRPASAFSVEDWRPPLYPVPPNAVLAAKLGVAADQPGGTAAHDATAPLQRALSSLQAGQTLLLEPGVYRISRPVFMPSGTAIQGAQGGDGRLLSALIQGAPFGTWTPGKLGLGMLMNQHYDAPGPEDANITVTALELNDQSYGIVFRMARDVLVRGCHFDGGQDGAAFLASHRTVVTDSLTTRTINSAYDYWDGDTDATVRKSVAILARGYGISFNAVDTDGTGREAANFYALNNVISGASQDAPAIYVNPLGGGSKITGRVVLRGNRISAPQPGAKTGGIYVADGDADIVDIQGNYIAESNGYLPIYVSGNRKTEGYANPGRPAQVLVLNNTMERSIVPESVGAVVWADGKRVDVSGNRLRGNRSAKGGPVGFLRGSGRIYAWDNDIADAAGASHVYNVSPGQLILHAPAERP